MMQSLASVLGIITIFLVAYLASNDRNKVRFDVAVKGLLLQFGLALFILRTSIGQTIFTKLSEGFQTVYRFADQGAAFVFGKLSDPSGPWEWIFAVKVIPIIIFFGALTSLLFHLGIIQVAVRGVASIIRPLLGTGGAETLCAAANSMLGQTEAPLLIKHYLGGMTDSQLLVVMVSGMSTLSGAILAVYGGMGVPMLHLLTASVMSIPGALVIAKIIYPEQTKMTAKKEAAQENVKATTANVLDAISTGTIDGLHLAVNVAAMLITFISLMGLINYLLGSLTFTISGVEITLDTIFGKFFYGVAYLIGLSGSELEAAGVMLGKKVIINEFVAYADLVSSTLSERSTAIMTYALCGFSNFSCIGIQIGGIGALVPEKRQKLTELGMRALLGGTLVNLLNAAIASLCIV